MATLATEPAPARRKVRATYPYLGLPVTAEQQAAWHAYRKLRGTTTAHLLEQAIAEYMSKRGVDFPLHPGRVTS